MAADIPASHDLSLIFESADVREVISMHCADFDAHRREDGYRSCPMCRGLRLALADAILVWKALCDMEAAK